MSKKGSFITYPFNKCLNPKYVLNKHTHQMVQATCGKCDACKMVRNNHYSSLCDYEEEDHRYCMFVTLTYADEYVPIVEPVFLDNGTADNTYFFVDDPDRWSGSSYVDDNGVVLHVDKCSPYWHVKYNSEYDFNRFMDFCALQSTDKQKIAVLNKQDLQNFFKRFRYYAKKLSIFDKFSYYAVGEYGPGKQEKGSGHLRPHYHVLFYFDSWTLFWRFKEILYKSWKFGFINFSRSRGRCSGYLGDYLNNSHRVPPLHATPAFKPFILHSSFFGTSFYQGKKEEIYKLRPEDFIRHTRKIGDKDTEVSAWRNLTSIFYPRCRFFSSHDDSLIYQLYTVYYRAVSFFGQNDSVQKLADDLLEYVTSKQYELDGKDCPWIFKILCYDDISDLDSVHRDSGQIYRDLSISKHFLEFVCNNNYEDAQPNILMIMRFYSKLKLSQLKQFYESQIVWSDVDFRLFYDNFKDDVSLKSTNLYRNWRSFTIQRAESAIKHKAQNAQVIPYL